MRISSMSFHALHLLYHLACQSNDAPLSASELAASCGISEHFIQKIMRSLQTKGLVQSQRGIAGGHKLARAPVEISLADIVIAVEGGIKLPEIKDYDLTEGFIWDVWSTASRRILQELRNVTLTDVFERHDNLSLTSAHRKKGHAICATVSRHPPVSLGRLRCRRPRSIPLQDTP